MADTKDDRAERTSTGKSQIRRFSGAFQTTTVSYKPTQRLAPTYRLEPKVPFNREICEKIMKEVMDKTFKNYEYKAKPAVGLCSQISEEIKNRVKQQNFDRYRYMCVVTIGEKVMQGFCSMVTYFWDAERDGCVSYPIETPNFFAVASLYYVYFD